MMGGRDCQGNCAKAVVMAQSCYNKFAVVEVNFTMRLALISIYGMLRTSAEFGVYSHVISSCDFQFHAVLLPTHTVAELFLDVLCEIIAMSGTFLVR